jgi:hypothetical protein
MMLSHHPTASCVSFFTRARKTAFVRACALLAFTTLLAGPSPAQNPSSRPVQDVVATATQDALTKTLAVRVRETWMAWKKGDAAAFAALTTDDYREVLATGTLHFYRFTSQEFAAFPISQFTISQLQAVPIGTGGALVTYVGLITFTNAGPGKFAFGEVWVKQGDEWRCQYSQATAMVVP